MEEVQVADCCCANRDGAPSGDAVENTCYE